jgi:uncharacterized protein (DUF924 family)
MGSDAIDDVLGFWFAPDRRESWFRRSDAFDREIEARFRPLMEEAAAGRLEHWTATARGSLALCILLDQFPRNVWRGTPRAFASDARAREVAGHALAAGQDHGLTLDERMFFYLPFEHSEDLEHQERCVRLMAELGDPDWLDYARRHRDIIARFGRFPHRNAVLGRTSTEEEHAFLQEPNSSF